MLKRKDVGRPDAGLVVSIHGDQRPKLALDLLANFGFGDEGVFAGLDLSAAEAEIAAQDSGRTIPPNRFAPVRR